MVLVRLGHDACPRPEGGSTVAIGFFDGVHLGHHVVLGEVRRLGAELGAESMVVTFDHHPATVVKPGSAPPLLTDDDQRLELLAAAGVDRVVVVPFDEVRAKERAEDFVTSVLVECLAARAVVVGEDFHFGHQRFGNVALLDALGQVHGFEVDGVSLLASGHSEARAVSSTAIRAALAAGDLATANTMLGRHHEVRGRVERGDARGRELGFPTANVAVPPEVCLPSPGIYATRYTRPDGQTFAAATSLGVRPTFGDGGALVLEAYLLDAHAEGDLDLYGEVARVSFVARLRDEARFDTTDELVAQIEADVAATRAALTLNAPRS